MHTQTDKRQIDTDNVKKPGVTTMIQKIIKSYSGHPTTCKSTNAILSSYKYKMK